MSRTALSLACYALAIVLFVGWFWQASRLGRRVEPGGHLDPAARRQLTVLLLAAFAVLAGGVIL